LFDALTARATLSAVMDPIKVITGYKFPTQKLDAGFRLAHAGDITAKFSIHQERPDVGVYTYLVSAETEQEQQIAASWLLGYCAGYSKAIGV